MILLRGSNIFLKDIDSEFKIYAPITTRIMPRIPRSEGISFKIRKEVKIVNAGVKESKGMAKEASAPLGALKKELLQQH